MTPIPLAERERRIRRAFMVPSPMTEHTATEFRYSAILRGGGHPTLDHNAIVGYAHSLDQLASMVWLRLDTWDRADYPMPTTVTVDAEIMRIDRVSTAVSTSGMTKDQVETAIRSAAEPEVKTDD